MQNQPGLVANESQLAVTSPASADCLENVEELFDHLNQAAESALPRGSRNYTAVFVLLLEWQNDDLGTVIDLNALERVFRGIYHYNTERYSIPSEEPSTQLEYRLNDFRRAHDNGTNLLIVCYGGHSRLDYGKHRPSRSIWYANQNSGAALVWSDLQGVLERAQSDVVFMMDCGYVASTSGCSGSKEGIWACNSQDTTSDVNGNSFTRNLVEDLESLSDSRFNVAMLHASFMRRYRGPGPYPLLSKPCYANLGNSAFPSIILEPQRESRPSAAGSPLTISHSMTEAPVLLTVRLKATEQMLTLSSWHNWYRHPVQGDADRAPAFGRLQIRDMVRLEAHYQGDPDILLLSMPIFIWHRLASRSAYSFVSLIKSTNLLFPERSVEVQKKRKIVSEDPEKLADMAKVAITHKKQGRWKEARELEVEVMETRKRMLGEEHPETLNSMANLALTYKNEDRWMEAHALEVKVMYLRKRTLGEEHLGTLTSMYNLSETLRGLGHYAQAVQMSEQTLALRGKVLGEESVGTLKSMANLATALRAQKKYAEAEQILQKTLPLMNNVLGKAHPTSLMAMNDLGNLMIDQKRYSEAEQMHLETLTLRRRVLGEKNLETLKSMRNLSKALDKQGKYANAETMHRENLELSEKVLGKDHSKTLVSMHNLARALDRQGKTEEAISIMEQCFQAQNRVFGSQNSNTKASLTALRNWKQVQIVELDT